MTSHNVIESRDVIDDVTTTKMIIRLAYPRIAYISPPKMLRFVIVSLSVKLSGSAACRNGHLSVDLKNGKWLPIL